MTEKDPRWLKRILDDWKGSSMTKKDPWCSNSAWVGGGCFLPVPLWQIFNPDNQSFFFSAVQLTLGWTESKIIAALWPETFCKPWEILWPVTFSNGTILQPSKVGVPNHKCYSDCSFRMISCISRWLWFLFRGTHRYLLKEELFSPKKKSTSKSFICLLDLTATLAELATWFSCTLARKMTYVIRRRAYAQLEL